MDDIGRCDSPESGRYEKQQIIILLYILLYNLSIPRKIGNGASQMSSKTEVVPVCWMILGKQYWPQYSLAIWEMSFNMPQTNQLQEGSRLVTHQSAQHFVENQWI